MLVAREAPAAPPRTLLLACRSSPNAEAGHREDLLWRLGATSVCTAAYLYPWPHKASWDPATTDDVHTDTRCFERRLL